jgi:hypothetical protein
LTDSGCESIAKLLERNKSITDLSIFSNPDITDSGMKKIKKALECNSSLKYFRCFGNPLVTMSVDTMTNDAMNRNLIVELKK